MAWIAAAMLFQLLGILILRRATVAAAADRIGPGMGLTAAGWALLLASAPLAAQGMGWELGIAWTLTVFSLVAFIVILPRLARLPAMGRPPRRPVIDRASKRRGTWITLTARLVAAGPLWLVAGLAVGLLVATRDVWLEENRLMAGGLAIPLVWAAGALHATADLSLPRLLLAPVLVTALFALGYLLT